MSESARSSKRSIGKITAVLLTAAMIVGTGLFTSLGAATAKAGSGILVAMLIGGHRSIINRHKRSGDILRVLR
jgi:L-asparagine transporter-like permease